MITLQEWLDQRYPTQPEKEQVKELVIDYRGLAINSTEILTREGTQQLTGSQLNLTNYPQLEKVTIWGSDLNSPLTNLILPENSCMREINCRDNNLTNLVISNQPQLTNLDCSWNYQLTKLSKRVS